MTTKSEIIEFSKSEWEHTFTDEQLATILKAECKCEGCGQSIFELDDFPDVQGDEVLCKYCYDDRYRLTCPICEDGYNKPTEPGGFLFVSENDCEEIGVVPGIYQITEWPYHYGCLIGGFLGFEPGSIKLLRECHPSSMKDRLTDSEASLEGAGDLCPDCAEQYIGKIYRPVLWCSPDRLNMNIKAWGIIQNGQ